MTEKLQRFIKEKIEKLPKESQQVISTIDWVKITEEIGKKYLLSEIEIMYLQVETLLILTGQEDINLYVQNIENEIGTSKNSANNISNEIIQKIFEPIEQAIEKKIKENIKNKKTTLEQDINFILSGGDYSVFITPNTDNGDDAEKADRILGSSSSVETKNRLIN